MTSNFSLTAKQREERVADWDTPIAERNEEQPPQLCIANANTLIGRCRVVKSRFSGIPNYDGDDYRIEKLVIDGTALTLYQSELMEMG